MTYLTVKCGTCRELYRAYRVTPDASLIRYCMYCGAPTVFVEVDPEWDVIDLLARHYNCTTSKVRMALSIWQDEVRECAAKHVPPTTFARFMGVSPTQPQAVPATTTC